jgi:hypothetical protein
MFHEFMSLVRQPSCDLGIDSNPREHQFIHDTPRAIREPLLVEDMKIVFALFVNVCRNSQSTPSIVRGPVNTICDPAHSLA